MPTCPQCHASGVFASHRRGILERGPLTWIGLLPYRCEQCRSRFYRFALGDFRWSFTKGQRRRPARWPLHMPVEVLTNSTEETGTRQYGRTENVSLEGIRVRLPTPLPPRTAVGVRLEGEPIRAGSVRWSGTREENPGTAHGIQFGAAGGPRPRPPRPFRRLLWRQRLRRAGLVLVWLLAIAASTYALFWLLEAFRVYDPKYYEPKDMERQQFEQGPRAAGR